MDFDTYGESFPMDNVHFQYNDWLPSYKKLWPLAMDNGSICHSYLLSDEMTLQIHFLTIVKQLAIFRKKIVAVCHGYSFIINGMQHRISPYT